MMHMQITDGDKKVLHRTRLYEKKNKNKKGEREEEFNKPESALLTSGLSGCFSPCQTLLLRASVDQSSPTLKVFRTTYRGVFRTSEEYLRTR